VNAATLRRLEALEARALDEQRRREEAACGVLLATMAPEHVALVRAASPAYFSAPEGIEANREPLVARLLRVRPPALVRAALMLLAWHLTEGRPLTLPDYVAEVYVNDPDALPGRACDACGYCMPLRGRLLPSGDIEEEEADLEYVGPCPVCAGYRNGQGEAAS